MLDTDKEEYFIYFASKRLRGNMRLDGIAFDSISDAKKAGEALQLPLGVYKRLPGGAGGLFISDAAYSSDDYIQAVLRNIKIRGE